MIRTSIQWLDHRVKPICLRWRKSDNILPSFETQIRIDFHFLVFWCCCCCCCDVLQNILQIMVQVKKKHNCCCCCWCLDKCLQSNCLLTFYHSLKCQQSRRNHFLTQAVVVATAVFVVVAVVVRSPSPNSRPCSPWSFGTYLKYPSMGLKTEYL